MPIARKLNENSRLQYIHVSSSAILAVLWSLRLKVGHILGGGFAGDLRKHGSWLAIIIWLIKLLRKSSIVAPNVGISARTIKLILEADITIELRSTVDVIESSKCASHWLGTTLDLGASQKHFYFCFLY